MSVVKDLVKLGKGHYGRTMNTVVRIFLVLIAGGIVHAQSAPSASERRVALVVGNGDYQVGSLANPTNDAEDIAAALRETGFEVTLWTDRTLSQMEDDLRSFRGTIQPGDVALFFYAGHGVQVDGANYLLPTDNQDIPDNTALRRRAMDAQDYVNAISEAGASLSMVLLDACRDNPLPATSRSGTRGLVPMSAPRGTETVIVFATRAGDVALDGTGRNSYFTRALVETLPTPDVEVISLFNQVGARVREETGGRQIPSIYSEPLSKSFAFVSADQVVAQARAASETKAREVAELERQIAARQAQIDAARTQAERDRLAVEQQRQEAILAAQRIEAENLAREAERQRAIAAAAAAARVREAQIAADAQAQQQQLATLAAARRDELLRLQEMSRSQDPDELIQSILELENAVEEIEGEYDQVWERIANEINRSYQQLLASLERTEPEFYETDAQFEQRIGAERTAMTSEQERSVSLQRAQVLAQRDEQLVEIKRQLDDAIQQLDARRWEMTTESVELSFESFDRNSQEWRFAFTSRDPAVPFQNWPLLVRFQPRSKNSESVAEWWAIQFDRSGESGDKIAAMQRFEDARKSDGLMVRVVWRIKREGDLFGTWIEKVILEDLVDQVQFEKPLDVQISRFEPGQRERGTAYVPLRISTDPYPAEITIDGAAAGQTQFQGYVPDTTIRIEASFASGLSKTMSVAPSRQPDIRLQPPVVGFVWQPYRFIFSPGYSGLGFHPDINTYFEEDGTNLVLFQNFDGFATMVVAPSVELWGGLTPALGRLKPRDAIGASSVRFSPIFGSSLVAEEALLISFQGTVGTGWWLESTEWFLTEDNGLFFGGGLDLGVEVGPFIGSDVVFVNPADNLWSSVLGLSVDFGLAGVRYELVRSFDGSAIAHRILVKLYPRQIPINGWN